MRVRVEVADTPAKLARGLMYRKHLPEDAGMLFIFSREQTLSFWGHNTFIPLDIAFINKQGRIEDIGRIRKLSDIMVRSARPSLMALEVNEGFFDRHGIRIGDRIDIESSGGECVVGFEAGSSAGKGEEQVKLSQSRRAPKNHPMLPFPETPGVASIPSVKKPTVRTPRVKPVPQVHPMLPFMQEDQAEPMPESMQGVNEPESQPDVDEPQGQQLPVIPMSQFMLADDDEHDELADGQPPVGDDEVGEEQQQQADEEVGPDSEEEPIPDASSMSVVEALQYAEQHGLVTWIKYSTLPKKRTIGPVSMPKDMTRIIQPHGIKHAKTTGNVLEVSWDLSVNDFRAFVIDRISDKGFTGQRFEKWFHVQ